MLLHDTLYTVQTSSPQLDIEMRKFAHNAMKEKLFTDCAIQICNPVMLL